MFFLDWPFRDPVEALALEEALLLWAEATGVEGLWLWEPHTWFVVLGRSSQPAQEVHLEACREDGVPVLRRVTGGGTVLLGPGCLVFSLVLRQDRHPALRKVQGTLDWVLEGLLAALRPVCPDLHRAGTGDLIRQDRKVCGTAQRRLRRTLLFHGSLLWDGAGDRMERYLRMPPRQPAYRRGRPHRVFVGTLPCSPHTIRERLLQYWAPQEQIRLPEVPALQQYLEETRRRWDHPRWRIWWEEGVRKVTTMGA